MKKILMFSVLVLCNTNLFSQNGALIQMQRDYDNVKMKIAQTRFEVIHLEADNIKVNGLIVHYNKQLKAIDDMLTKNRNYRQSNIDLDNLIKLFYTHPEMAAFIKNYNDYKEAESFRMTLVQNNSLTLEKFEAWKKAVLDDFKAKGGTNYNYANGNYNSINTNL